MVMDRPFTTASPITASYSFSELLSNFGIINFYPTFTASYVAGNVDSPYLSTNVDRTSLTNTNKKNSETLTFDSTAFTTAQTIIGTATLTYSMALNRVFAGTASGRWNFELFRLRGVVETSLGEVDGEQITTAAAGVYAAFTESIAKIDLTETKLIIGDKLRLVLTAITRESAGPVYDDIRIYTNPENVEQDGVDTIFKLDVPFKIFT